MNFNRKRVKKGWTHIQRQLASLNWDKVNWDLEDNCLFCWSRCNWPRWAWQQSTTLRKLWLWTLGIDSFGHYPLFLWLQLEPRIEAQWTSENANGSKSKCIKLDSFFGCSGVDQTEQKLAFFCKPFNYHLHFPRREKNYYSSVIVNGWEYNNTSKHRKL